MILKILLTVETLGIGSLVLGELFGPRRWMQGFGTSENQSPAQQRNAIKKDLDRLRLLYEQGSLPEDRYFRLVDQQIDKMNTLSRAKSASLQQ